VLIYYFYFTSKIKEESKKMSDEPHHVTDEEDEPNPIDLIAAEMDRDRIHLDSLRLDRRMNAKDYDFITRLPLSANQLINILYELYPRKKDCDLKSEDGD